MIDLNEICKTLQAVDNEVYTIQLALKEFDTTDKELCIIKDCLIKKLALLNNSSKKLTLMLNLHLNKERKINNSRNTLNKKLEVVKNKRERKSDKLVKIIYSIDTHGTRFNMN